MVALFVTTLALVGALMAAMAIGVMISGRRLRGSCGGVGADCWCEKNPGVVGACPEEHSGSTP